MTQDAQRIKEGNQRLDTLLSGVTALIQLIQGREEDFVLVLANTNTTTGDTAYALGTSTAKGADTEYIQHHLEGALAQLKSGSMKTPEELEESIDKETP